MSDMPKSNGLSVSTISSHTLVLCSFSGACIAESDVDAVCTVNEASKKKPPILSRLW